MDCWNEKPEYGLAKALVKVTQIVKNAPKSKKIIVVLRFFLAFIVGTVQQILYYFTLPFAIFNEWVRNW